MTRDLAAGLRSLFEQNAAAELRSGQVSPVILGGLREQVVKAARGHGGSGTSGEAIAKCVRSLQNNERQCREGKLDNGNGLLHLLAQSRDFQRQAPEARAAAIAIIAPVIDQILPQIAWENLARRAPLHIACFYGNLVVAEALISRGANIQARDLSGDTPLHDAALHGDPEGVALLLSFGADGLARNLKGETPWQTATRVGNHETAGLPLSFQERLEMECDLPAKAARSAPARRI